MTKRDYHNRFLTVLCSNSPEQAAEDLRVLANAAWHRGWSPDVEAVSPPLRRKAAYLADFFASNQAMPLEQSRQLKERLKVVKMTLSESSPDVFYANQNSVRTNRDALAKKVGPCCWSTSKASTWLIGLAKKISSLSEGNCLMDHFPGSDLLGRASIKKPEHYSSTAGSSSTCFDCQSP